MLKNIFIFSLTLLIVWELNYRLEVIFPQNFDSIALVCLASIAALESPTPFCCLILLIQPDILYVIILFWFSFWMFSFKIFTLMTWNFCVAPLKFIILSPGMGPFNIKIYVSQFGKVCVFFSLLTSSWCFLILSFWNTYLWVRYWTSLTDALIFLLFLFYYPSSWPTFWAISLTLSFNLITDILC